MRRRTCRLSGAAPRSLRTSGVTWVGEVALSWQPPDGGAGAAVSGYEYRYFPAEDSAPDNWTSLSANARTLTLGGLSDEVAYRFELRARTAGDPGAKRQG